MLAHRRSSALLALRPSPAMLTHRRATALLAVRFTPAMLADRHAPALLAIRLAPAVLADVPFAKSTFTAMAAAYAFHRSRL